MGWKSGDDGRSIEWRCNNRAQESLLTGLTEKGGKMRQQLKNPLDGIKENVMFLLLSLMKEEVATRKGWKV